MVQHQIPIVVVVLLFPAFTFPCKVYPLEYAYHTDYVNRVESVGVCKNYPSGNDQAVHKERYIHCDGTQLKLTDSDLGQEQYHPDDYYVWNAGRDGRLLFVLPTRVSLTTITLYYYSDRDRGLPGLRFYAVPDEFDIWEALTTSYPQVDVASVSPGGEPAGQRSVSINVNFNTRRVLMYKFSSTFKFAVSEVEFFKCTSGTTSSTTIDPVTTSTLLQTSNMYTRRDSAITTQDVSDMKILNFTTTNLSRNRQESENMQTIIIIAVGVAATALIVLVIVGLLLLLLHRKRRSRVETDSSGKEENSAYSTLNRGVQQRTQAQDPTGLYDQIHLSPSTGQTELISKHESETTEDALSTSTSNFYSTIDKKDPQPVSTSETGRVTQVNAMYTVVHKKKTKEATWDKNTVGNHDTEIEKGINTQDKRSLEDMYAVVHKKPKKSEEQEEAAPPIPEYTVESLYTAVQKKSRLT